MKICLHITLLVIAFTITDAVRTCETHRLLGAMTSGFFEIDPDGPGPLAPFTVWCDLSTDPVATRVSHNRESRTSCPKVSAAYGATLSVTYASALVPQIRSLVEQSDICFYTFKYDCKGVLMTNHLGLTDFSGKLHGSWWRDYGGGFCKGNVCTCDVNDQVSRSEEGIINFKEAFPITSFKMGDTDASIESASITLGPLICQGAVGDKLRFKILPSKHYTGPGLSFIMSNPTCRPNMCVMACLAHAANCRAAGLSKQPECQCYLYDKTYLANSDKILEDSTWDLLVFYNNPF